jgi:hypothetical protein
MRRLSIASALLFVGGAVTIVGLPLQWFSESAPDGTTLTRTGLDYAAYDVATTIAFGALLIVAAAALAAARRWAEPASVVIALLACLWGALVVIAAASPADGGTSDVKISIGLGVYAVAAGAVLGIAGALLGIRGRTVSVITSGVQTSV